MVTFRSTLSSAYSLLATLAFCCLVCPQIYAGDRPERAAANSLPATSTTADSGKSGTLEVSVIDHTKVIRVGIYDNSTGTAKGPKNLRRFLVEDAGFKCIKLTPSDIQNGKLSDIDVLIMPGGSGSAQAKNLGEQGCKNVRDFVQAGGGYVGICAGAYLASAHYTWSLNLMNAQVVDREHWARGTGTCRLKLTSIGKSSLAESEEEIEVYYGQGPLLAPYDNKDLPAYETLAEYATEIAKKGAPTGVMIGTTAIARACFGDGRVICFSPHPEVSDGPNHLIIEGVKWVAKTHADPKELNDE